jgi:hypothetical protein
LISLSIGKLSKEELKKAGVNEAAGSGDPGVFFKEYEGLGHSADVQEIKDWADWLERAIPPS